MSGLSKKYEICLLLAAVAITLASSRGASAHANLKPDWARPLSSLACDAGANDSFLADVDPSTEKLLRDKIFDPKLAIEMRQRYDDATREYRMREQHDLTSPDEQRAYLGRMASFTMDVIQELKRYHWREKIGDVRRATIRAVKNGNALVQAISKPIGLAIAAAAISTGQPVSVRVAEDTQLTARTNVERRKGGVDVVSPIVNGSVAFAGKSPTTRDPYALPPINPDEREERYSFALSRGVPLLDVTTGVSYGSTSTTMTASVSKELMSNLTCVLDTSKPARPERSTLPQGQESVKLLYGIRF